MPMMLVREICLYDLVMNRFWHAEQPLIDGTTIPYWATTDRTSHHPRWHPAETRAAIARTWNDQRFNVLQAQQIAAQGMRT